jgi:hypothetical protein
MKENILVQMARGCMHSPLLAEKSYQNTWFSGTLDFSLHGFLLVSTFSPTLCTVVTKKFKASSFGEWADKNLLHT